MGLGQRVRELRQTRGMTQEQLAGEELTKSFISLLEQDKSSPSIETAALIAQRLGTSVDALLGSQGHLQDQVISGLLALSADSARRRNLSHAAELLKAAEILINLFPLAEAGRELKLQQAQMALEGREFARARVLATEAGAQADDGKDLWRSARALTILGQIGLKERKIPEAIQSLKQALTLLTQARASRDPVRVEALIFLGSALVYQGQYGDAIRRYNEAAQSQVASHHPILRGRALWGAGAAFRHLGEFAAAFEALEAARDIFEKSEELPDLVSVLHNLGQAALEHGRPKDALPYLLHALRVVDRLPMPDVRASTRTEIGRVHVALGNLEDAAAFATQALEGARMAGDPVEVAEAQTVLARIAFARGDSAEGTRLMKAAAAVFAARGMEHRIRDLARDAGFVLLEHA
jgi:transcriptional regulator with XRE-family HTH domain